MKREIEHLYRNGHGRLIPMAVVRDFVRFVAIKTGKHEQLFSRSFKKKHLSAQSWYWK